METCEMCERIDRDGWNSHPSLSHCRHCHGSWPRASERQHCTTCHETFSGVSASDKHWVKPAGSKPGTAGQHTHPSQVERLAQRPDGTWTIPMSDARKAQVAELRAATR